MQGIFFRGNRYNGNQPKIPCPLSQREFRFCISRLQFAGYIDNFRKHCTGISNQQSPCRERRTPHFGYSRKAEYQRYSKQISLSGIGRSKQRCACARAIINNPKLLLADEPTGALDSHSSQMLLSTIQSINEQLRATILMVTHDAFTASYASRILF